MFILNYHNWLKIKNSKHMLMPNYTFTLYIISILLVYNNITNLN